MGREGGTKRTVMENWILKGREEENKMKAFR
jgi:hypothetical protein